MKSISQRIFSKGKSVADEFNRFFVSVGQNSVDKIQSLANECNITLNQNYFIPKQYPLCEQFNLKPLSTLRPVFLLLLVIFLMISPSLF